MLGLQGGDGLLQLRRRFITLPLHICHLALHRLVGVLLCQCSFLHSCLLDSCQSFLVSAKHDFDVIPCMPALVLSLDLSRRKPAGHFFQLRLLALLQFFRPRLRGELGFDGGFDLRIGLHAHLRCVLCGPRPGGGLDLLDFTLRPLLVILRRHLQLHARVGTGRIELRRSAGVDLVQAQLELVDLQGVGFRLRLRGSQLHLQVADDGLCPLHDLLHRLLQPLALRCILLRLGTPGI